MGKLLAILVLVACCIMGFEYVGEYKPERCSVEGCRQRRAWGRDICTDHLHGYLPMPDKQSTTEKPVVKTTVTTTTEATTCELAYDPEVFTGSSPEEQESYVDRYPDNIERRVAAERATETTTYSYNYGNSYGSGYNHHYSKGNHHYNSYNHHYYYEPEPDEGEVYDFYKEHRNEFKSYEDAYDAYEDDIDYWDEDYDDWDDWE